MIFGDSPMMAKKRRAETPCVRVIQQAWDKALSADAPAASEFRIRINAPMPGGPVAALFVRGDSIYKEFAEVECYDANRNALNYPGPFPVVAHPPCRAWGKLSRFAKPAPGERGLAIWALACVRKFGGVLEHPEGSTLWSEQGVVAPGCRQLDFWGGFTVTIRQCEFGHKAEKKTRLYIVGGNADALLPPPWPGREPTHCIANPARPNLKTTAEREATPPPLAARLLSTASACRPRISATGALSPPRPRLTRIYNGAAGGRTKRNSKPRNGNSTARGGANSI